MATTQMLPYSTTKIKAYNIARIIKMIRGVKILKSWNEQGLITKQVTVSLASSIRDKLAITYKGIISKMLDQYVKSGEISSFSAFKRGKDVYTEIYFNTFTRVGIHAPIMSYNSYYNKNIILCELLEDKLKTYGAASDIGNNFLRVRHNLSFTEIESENAVIGLSASCSNVNADFSLMFKRDEDTNLSKVEACYNKYLMSKIFPADMGDCVSILTSLRKIISNGQYTLEHGSFPWQGAIDNIKIAMMYIISNEEIDKDKLGTINMNGQLLSFLGFFKAPILCRSLNRNIEVLKQMMVCERTCTLTSPSSDSLTRPLPPFTWGAAENMRDNESFISYAQRIFNDTDNRTTFSNAIIPQMYIVFLSQYSEEQRRANVTYNSFTKDLFGMLYDMYMFVKNAHTDNGKDFIMTMPEFENFDAQLLE